VWHDLSHGQQASMGECWLLFSRIASVCCVGFGLAVDSKVCHVAGVVGDCICAR